MKKYKNIYRVKLGVIEKAINQISSPYQYEEKKAVSLCKKLTALKIDYNLFGGSDELKPRIYQAEKTLSVLLEPF